MTTADNLSRGAKNTIRRMVAGETFYVSQTPRLSRERMREIEAAGFDLQEENPLHEPTMIYPLRLREFIARALEFGIITQADADREKHRSVGRYFVIKKKL